jgi:hypothetical protein
MFTNIEVAAYVVAVLSCVCTLFVMATYWAFPEMRKKRFMKFIFYMTVCDFAVGVISFLGFPQSGTALCDIQGVVVLYFMLGSWFWTTARSYSIYVIVTTGKSVNDVYLHVVCWLLPLVLSLLPFSDATYGSGDGQWCEIVNKSSSPKNARVFWAYFSCFGWLFLCAFLMINWSIIARFRMWKQSAKVSRIIKGTYDRVAWYPVAIIVCWFLNYFCIVFASSNRLISTLSMIFGVSYGAIAAGIFFAKSDEARRRWYDTLFPYTPKVLRFRESVGAIPIDFEEELGIIAEPYNENDAF